MSDRRIVWKKSEEAEARRVARLPDYYCELCEKTIKRDSSAETIKSYCSAAGKSTVLKRVADGR